jgi:hypothetical protein
MMGSVGTARVLRISYMASPSEDIMINTVIVVYSQLSVLVLTLVLADAKVGIRIRKYAAKKAMNTIQCAY